MAYDLGQTGQQFENKINRSDIASREKNEGGCWENKENALGEKQDKTRKTKRLEYAQRQGKKKN